MITAADLGNVARRVGLGPQPSPKPVPSPPPPHPPAESTTTSAVTSPGGATTFINPGPVSATASMSTSAASSSGAPTPPQSGTSTPATPPDGVTEVRTINGVEYWMVPGQYVTDTAGTKQWMPEHWVRAGSITTTTIPPNTVPPPVSHDLTEDDYKQMVLKAGLNNVPVYVFGYPHDDPREPYKSPGSVDQMLLAKGAPKNEMDYFHKVSNDALAYEHGTGGGHNLVDDKVMFQVVDGYGIFVLRSYKQAWQLAHDFGPDGKPITPRQWYVDAWFTAMREKTNNGGFDPPKPNPPTPPPPTPPPGSSGVGLPKPPAPAPVTAQSAAASSTMKTLAIAAVAAGVAWLFLGCNGDSDTMSCTNVLKRTLRYPFILPSGSRSTIGCPELPQHGTNILIDSGVGTPTTIDPTDPFTVPVQSFNNAKQRIQVPAFDGRLRGVGIAPDSAIDTCDVALNGLTDESNRFRIGIGDPLIGDFGVQTGQTFLDVTLPNPLPDVELDAPGKIAVWDSIGISPSVGGGTFASFPLRLEFFYGDIMPIRSDSRPPMSAAARCLLTAGGTVHFVVCVAGRKRVRLAVIPQTGTATVSVVENIPNPPSINSVRWSSTQISVLAAVAVPTAKVFDLTTGVNTQAPYGTLDIAVTDSAGTGATQGHYILLQAWDAPTV